MISPRLSFVMPCYNNLEWLGEAISSCLVQTVPEIELIIVDDCSTDGSKEFLDEWASKLDGVTVIHNEKNLGAGKSRNIGMEAARAPIIAICDADDIYANERAALILKHFELNPKSEMVNFPNIAIGYCNEKVEENQGLPFDHDLFLKEGKITYFSNPTVGVKKESLKEIGGYGEEYFNETARNTDDFLMVEKWVKAGKKIDFQPGYFVTFHRNSPNSMMAKMRGFKPEWVAQ